MTLTQLIAQSARHYKLAIATHFFVKSGLFEVLCDGPKRVPALTRDLGVEEERLLLFLKALASSKLIKFEGNNVSLIEQTVNPEERRRLLWLVQYHEAAINNWMRLGDTIFEKESVSVKSGLHSEALYCGMKAVHLDHKPLLKTLLETKKHGNRILDIGGGSGLCAQEVLDIDPKAQITIVDPVWYGPDELLELDGVDWIKQMPAKATPGYNLILCINLLHCLKRAEVFATLSTLADLLRVSRGYVLLQDFVETPPIELGCGVSYLLLGQTVNGGWAIDWDLAELEKIFRKCGLLIESMYRTDQKYLGHPSAIWTLTIPD